ncbi:MobP3 family relaxase [uncultured Oscillibacter sp.]|uniref:MobP3 family relaxase n=1 Tax=uncultured Oscillibacter sp. TaxID=876091 RepID=UPI00272DC6A7|nr:MobP3 family relaxase [uncultured Oscillibacter sp.]
MVRLIQKSGYIKTGNASGYMKYIATRERVEKLEGSAPVTKGQQQLIENLLRDFPDANKLDEYSGYRLAPTTGNASALISAVLDANAHKFTDRDGYMKYIATRPRVERHGEHGLFSNRPVSLDAALKEVETHTGNVWTFIWSLRREDAARLGYDHAESWRKLIKAHQAEIAEAMKIPPDQLRWYAAFHDEGHHPHVHAMVWSADPKQGRLTKEGVKMIRSKLTNDIFQDEMYTLYQEKDVSYKELVAMSRRTMKELLEKMRSGSCGSPVIENKLLELSQLLETVKGKKVYGYLKKPVKAQVDAIVDELAKLPEVAECYEVWNGLRDELEGYYKDVPRHRLPLSQQKEFRTIKNLVIQEAENLRQGVFTFEDAEMNDEPEMDSEVLPQGVGYQAATLLYDDEITQAEKREALRVLEQLWDKDFTSAAYHLGRAYRDGLGLLPDDEKAEKWFRRSADTGNVHTLYVLGKLLQEQGRLSEAVSWYEHACKSDSQYAQYSLGKMYLLGNGVPKDVSRAIQLLRSSANQGNQYAQYVLGKLCLQGKEVEKNPEAAEYWLTRSAVQGNAPAQFLLDHRQHNPSVLLCTARLLHHMSNIFWETLPPPNPAGGHVESKLMGRIREKKIAMGHKPDDHEEYQGPSMSM